MPFNNSPIDPNAAFPDPADIIGANGGTGTWEAEGETEVQRWLFPRFAGAESIGTCALGKSAKWKSHKGIHTEDPKCKNFTPDMGNMYLSRSGIGAYDTDVETVVGWMEAPRNVVGGVLLLGDPGTGKTALIEAAATRAERDLLTVLCTPDHTRDSLFMRFMGEGKGDDGTAFTLGPLPYAAKHGHWLYMDEFMLLMDGVKPLTYSLADGRRYLPEGNLDGSPLEIHPNFRFIVSSNKDVRGASLPEPMGSRFASTTLTVDTSAEFLRDLGIDEAVVTAWEALGTLNLWRPAIRELRMADYWLNLDADQAVSAFLGEHCPESQRKAIRDQVVAHLGGENIRDDGRLVVS